MNLKIIRFFMILLIIFFSGIPLNTAGCHKETEVIELNKSDDGKSISLVQGQVLQAALEANPTTGYSWVKVSPKKDDVLEPLGEPEYKSSGNLLGSGGHLILRYKASNPGKVELELHYRRPWEKTEEPEDTFHIEVHVQSK